MEHVKLFDEIGTTDVSTAVNTAAVHLNAINQRNKPGSTSRALQVRLGVAACLVLLFLVGLCSRLITSRLPELVGKRRLAWGGGAPGKEEGEGEGDKQCFPGSSEPTEDNKTSIPELPVELQHPTEEPQDSGLEEEQLKEEEKPPGAAAPSLGFPSHAPSATPPAEEPNVGAGQEVQAGLHAAGPPSSAEEQMLSGAGAAPPQHSSHPHGGAPNVGVPRKRHRDRVRERREKITKAFEYIYSLLQEGLEGLYSSWQASDPHWPYCQALFDALKYFGGQASALFNAENSRYGFQERLEWINVRHAEWEKVITAWNVLAAFASAHYLDAPESESPPTGLDIRIQYLVDIEQASLTLKESMEEYKEKGTAETLALLNASHREISSLVRDISRYFSRPSSPSGDLLSDTLREKLVLLRGEKLESMRMLSTLQQR